MSFSSIFFDLLGGQVEVERFKPYDRFEPANEVYRHGAVMAYIVTAPLVDLDRTPLLNPRKPTLGVILPVEANRLWGRFSFFHFFDYWVPDAVKAAMTDFSVKTVRDSFGDQYFVLTNAQGYAFAAGATGHIQAGIDDLVSWPEMPAQIEKLSQVAYGTAPLPEYYARFLVDSSLSS